MKIKLYVNHIYIYNNKFVKSRLRYSKENVWYIRHKFVTTT